MKLTKFKGMLMATAFLSFMNCAFTQPKMTENGLSEDISDGAILHVWCWSFNTIRKNLKEIAAAGFSAIQTSPISQCLAGEDGGLEIFGHGKWYYHYQPTKYVVGNYQLGTEKEFIALCEDAHRYGIKVIVDSVINHCTATWDAIDPGLRNIQGDGFHAQNGYWSETDRYEETQFALSGLWDLNTQNPNVQNLVRDFLRRCVQDGADGFRYDAAKLIELPDDVTSNPDKYTGTVLTHPRKYTVEKFTSEFWPVVLDNGAKFQYGEILQEGGNISYSKEIESGYDDSLSSRLADYQKYMKTTNSMYGFRIRDAARHNNFNAAFISDKLLPRGAKAENVVTWVESHDNYCNDASYKELDVNQVVRAWAVIASRKNGTPLFFSRPEGSGANNPWGTNRLGNAGSSMFKDAQVVEVNFFRNAMAGEEEHISNPTGEDSIAMIERGNRGAVIVNSKESDVELESCPVKSIADGTYTDQVYGGKFTVKNGAISGKLKAGSVAVIYDKNIKSERFASEVESSETSGYFLTDSMDLTIKARNVSEIKYQIDRSPPVSAENGTKLTIGRGIPFGKTIKLTITAKGSDSKKIVKKYTYRKNLYRKDTVIYFDPAFMGADWKHNRVCAYIYNSDGSRANASWPGVEMEKLQDGTYRYVLPYELESQSTNVIFNNGGGGKGNQYPEGAGLGMRQGTQMILQSDGSWKTFNK